MISFIVIGRNIEPTAEKCFGSILNFIEYNSIKSYEVIYADSDSTDKSIEIAKKFFTKIISIKGECNAAVGRNEGARHANGDIFFFLDGDMELQPECYNVVFKNETELVYPFLRGILLNKFYTTNFKQLIKKEQLNRNFTSNSYKPRPTTGGLFVIKKEFWIKLNGMDDRLNVNEDVDFGLRMNSLGIKQRIYNTFMAYHSMISYYDIQRLKKFLLTNMVLCSGVVIRKHLFQIRSMKYFIRSRYSLFLLFSIVILYPFVNFLSIIMLTSCYIFLQIIRSSKIAMKESHLLFIIFYKIFYDFYTIIGFLFYFPKPKRYKSIIIDN